MQAVRMKITELRPHPLQQQIYGDLDRVEFRALKEDLEELGQRQPIEVDGVGTILDGHQRVRALQDLGHKEVDSSSAQISPTISGTSCSCTPTSCGGSWIPSLRPAH